MNFSQIWRYGIDTAILKQTMPFVVHISMFLPCLIGQCSLEQQGEWVPRAFMNNILGTYAQV